MLGLPGHKDLSGAHRDREGIDTWRVRDHSGVAMPGVDVSQGTHEPGKANYHHRDVRTCVFDARRLGTVILAVIRFSAD